jgi:hypothetical protein
VLTKSLLLALALAAPVAEPAEPPFRVGEKLSYVISWGPLLAGRATMEVVGLEQVDGHDCYRLRATARTVCFADTLFHVNSTTEAWLDAKGFFTRRHKQDRTEGRHVVRDEARYDYDQKLITVTNLVNGRVKSIPLNGPVCDVISAVYHVRAQPLKLNAALNFSVLDGRSNCVVNVAPDQRRTVTVRALGDVEALRLEPKPTLPIVAANNGRLWFWVSDDERRLPLVVVSTMAIGNARLLLEKIEPAPVKPTNILPRTGLR